jgi:hypothetical protein
MDRSDKERAVYIKRYYGVDRGLPSHHDLVVSTDCLTSDVCTLVLDAEAAFDSQPKNSLQERIIVTRVHPSMTDGADRTIQLSDGRRLGYAEFGDRGGAPVIYFHGCPERARRLRRAGPIAALHRLERGPGRSVERCQRSRQ